MRVTKFFEFENYHIPSCGIPPKIEVKEGRCIKYFENRHGEQAIYVHEANQSEGTLYMGDAGWETAYNVKHGVAIGLILNKEEQEWLLMCWEEASGEFFSYKKYYKAIEESILSSLDPIEHKTIIKEIKSGFYKKFGSLSPSTRFEVFKRDNYKCQVCGKKQEDGDELEVDHRVPRANGGTNELENLWTLCLKCNRGKSDKDL